MNQNRSPGLGHGYRAYSEIHVFKFGPIRLFRRTDKMSIKLNSPYTQMNQRERQREKSRCSFILTFRYTNRSTVNKNLYFNSWQILCLADINKLKESAQFY